MPDFKFGTPIYYKDFRKNYEMMSDKEPGDITEDEVNKAMAEQAMKAKDEQVNEAIKQLNGMKEDYGTGVSTRVMVYNGLGVPLRFKSKHDDYGYWSANTLADRIEVGQWSIGFHHKKSAAASGSCGVVGYDLLGYGHDDVLMIGFSTPWGSAGCTVLSKVMTTAAWSALSWEKIMQSIYKSSERNSHVFGRATVTCRTQQDTSPTVEVIVKRSGIGF